MHLNENVSIRIIQVDDAFYFTTVSLQKKTHTHISLNSITSIIILM